MTATGQNVGVTLSWNALPKTAFYEVNRSTTNGGPYTNVANIWGGTGYGDPNVNNGVTYYYVVIGVGATTSAPSNQASATPNPPGVVNQPVIPAAPTGLNAAAGNATVSLRWNGVAGATSYNVKRSTANGGPYTTIASPSSPLFTDNSVSNGTTYYYVVSALNSAGESANSSQVLATPQAPILPPAAPTGLNASAGNATVVLMWNGVTGATSYNVKRSTTNGGPYTTISSPSSPLFTDNSVTNGTTYYYVVSAVGTGGESANSSQVSATPQAPILPPAAPTGLNANAGNATVGLMWNGVTGATSYNVKRSNTNGGPYTTVSSPSSPLFTDNSVTNGTTYYYVVSAVGTGGESGYSSQVAATPVNPITIPSAPTGLSAKAGNANVALTWSGSTGATSYNIKRATVSGGPYTTISSSATNGYTDSSVVNGTTYYYVVTTVNSAGESGNSNEANAKPTAPANGTIVLTAVGQNVGVTLSWNSLPGTAFYAVQRSTVSGGPYTNVANLWGGTSYGDPNVNNGVTYFYVVYAVGQSGQSPPSNEASATPHGSG